MGLSFLRDLGVVSVLAAAASASLIVLLRPMLMRYALARPNARSSHVTPTPQGGGIAVIAATLAATAAAQQLSQGLSWAVTGSLGLSVLILAVLGAYDDVRPLNALQKLIFQVVAVTVMVAFLPDALRITPTLPLWLERGGEVVAGLYVVNLVNFMDGIDWMTVGEVVPVSAAIVPLAILGAVAPSDAILAAALLGAMLGFAPFNRPVAKLFLGDVGSLPIGLLLFYLMIVLAGRGHFAVALILPMYYLADATLTLARRTLRGDNIFEAHRTHVYQLARARGMSVQGVVGRVFAVNVLLALLAIATVWIGHPLASVGALLVAAALVTVLLVDLSRGAR